MIRLFARSLVAALTIGVLTVSHQATAQTDSNTETPILRIRPVKHTFQPCGSILMMNVPE